MTSSDCFALREGTRESLAMTYLRAWARHEVFITLASRDAFARSGLNAGMAVELFGTSLAELPASGALQYSPHGAGTVDVIVEDDALICRFPHDHADRARRGELNDAFLRPERFAERLAAALAPLGEAIRLVVLHPAPLYRTEEITFAGFLDLLDRFLSLLPPSYRYALEPAGPLCFRREYFACLNARGVAHVLSEGETLFRTLPPLSDQLVLPGVLDHPFCVVRTMPDPVVPGMLRPPPDALLRRQGWCDVVRRCLAEHRPVYLFADDAVDPLRSLMAFMTMMNEDLAERSVIRSNAA